jgi:hypothetical protein
MSTVSDTNICTLLPPQKVVEQGVNEKAFFYWSLYHHFVLDNLTIGYALHLQIHSLLCSYPMIHGILHFQEHLQMQHANPRPWLSFHSAMVLEIHLS